MKQLWRTSHRSWVIIRLHPASSSSSSSSPPVSSSPSPSSSSPPSSSSSSSSTSPSSPAPSSLASPSSSSPPSRTCQCYATDQTYVCSLFSGLLFNHGHGSPALPFGFVTVGYPRSIFLVFFLPFPHSLPSGRSLDIFAWGIKAGLSRVESVSVSPSFTPLSLTSS